MNIPDNKSLSNSKFGKMEYWKVGKKFICLDPLSNFPSFH